MSINIPKRDDLQVVAVLAIAVINPHVSTRQIQRELDIPMSTTHRILVIYNFHSYHIALAQDLTLMIFVEGWCFIIGHKQCCKAIVYFSSLYCLMTRQLFITLAN